jgi:glycosyltransferase involved in cell wall biosynthesis
MRVLFLGQVNVRKGVVELLEAARLLREEPIEFVVVGGVSAGFSLRDVPENVNVVGPVARGEVDACFRAADVFILPTHSDGFALTQLEAQAHGLPVIASRFCGDVVRDGVNGLLLNEVTGAAMAQCLRELVSNPARLAAMSASSSVDERFSLRRIGDDFAAGRVI